MEKLLAAGADIEAKSNVRGSWVMDADRTRAEWQHAAFNLVPLYACFFLFPEVDAVIQVL